MALATPRAGAVRARITCDDGVCDVAERLQVQWTSKPAPLGRSMQNMRLFGVTVMVLTR
jgi:hypothetical protein